MVCSKLKFAHWLLFLTLLLLILLAIKINKPVPSSLPLPQPMETILTPFPQNKENCEASGGRWGRIGINPKESCNLPTKDAGKECSDSSECEGFCLVYLTPEQESQIAAYPISIKGKCASWKITVGCLALVDKGKVNGITCLD